MRRDPGEQWRVVELPGMRWWVHPRWLPQLLDAHGLRWQTWMADERVETVKQAPHRTVHRVRLDAGPVYIKEYPTRDWRSRLRQWFRVTKARREWQHTLAAAARALPTVEPIALGEGSAQQSYLVTAELPDATTLDRLILERGGRLSPVQRRRLAWELGRFIARLHAAGIHHHDLHAGNILVRQVGADWNLTLLDLYAVQVGRPLSKQESIANLALLGNWFLNRTSRTDRARFWRSYRSSRPEIAPSKARKTDVRRRLECMVWQRHLEVWRQRAVRCLKSNREFRREKAADRIAWSTRSLEAVEAEKWLREPDLALQRLTGKVLKDGRSSRVVCGELCNRTVVAKRFTSTTGVGPWLQRLQGSPAQRSWFAGFLLAEAGIPTARPLVCVERRRGAGTRESWLVTEYLGNTTTLRAYADGDGSQEDASAEALLRVLQRAVDLVARLHRYGISHRDLKAANWLVRCSKDATGPELFLIDLVGVRRKWWLSFPCRVQNLARLALSFQGDSRFSRTQALRLLLRYLKHTDKLRKEWKRWWRALVSAMQRKTAKNARSGRPLT